MPVTDPRHYATEALLRDGGSIRLRAIQPDDTSRLLALLTPLSQGSVYGRFFPITQCLSEAELRHLTEVDFVRNAALVATLREAESERIIGVGHYYAVSDSGQPGNRAEVVFEMAAAHRGRGIGTLLCSLAPGASTASKPTCWVKITVCCRSSIAAVLACSAPWKKVFSTSLFLLPRRCKSARPAASASARQQRRACARC